MFTFFQTILGILDTVLLFILDIFSMLGFMINYIFQGFGYAVSCLMFLPPWVLPFVTAVIAFSVIMFLLNR